MNDNGNTNERIINLKDLFIKVLNSWRFICAFGLIIGIMLCGYKYISQSKLLNNESYIQAQEDNYNKQYKLYEKNKTELVNEIENIKNSIKQQEDYCNNSVLMQINPYNKYVISLGYYIDSNYEIMPNMAYQNVDITKSLIRSYQSLALNGEMLNYIKNNLSYDIEIKYLKEIINVYAEFDNNMMFIQIMHKNQELCEEIYKIIIEYLDQAHTKLNKSIGQHTLSNIDESSETIIDLDMETFKESNNQKIVNYNNVLNEKENALESLQLPIKIIEKNTILISSLKYLLFGIILGFMFSIGLILLKYISSDKLININDIRNRLGIKVLGIINNKKKKDIFYFIDKSINSLDNIVYEDENQVLERMSSYIRAIYKTENNNVNIVLTGTIHINEIESISVKIKNEIRKLPYSILAKSNISYNGDTINAVKESDFVIIIEKLNVSTYNEIAKQLEYITDLDKKVLGIILIK